jgi:GT2 family glycosyltransferase
MTPGFVVLTYNRPDALLAVLRALAPQCPPDAVVVIADDGSRPDSVAALRSGLPLFSCRARHVWHPDVGFTAARARNLGALHAQADYLVFLDGDCVPGPGFVDHHRRLAQDGHFVNGSRVLLNERLSGRVLRGEIELGRLTALDWLRLRLAGDVNKLTHLLYWPAVPGRVQDGFQWNGIRSCNFGVWYRDLQAVNGFDESFSGWGHEDADLVLRLHHHGLRRKNGHLATEVYHLWHPENSRAEAESNRRKVHRRVNSGMTRAEIGLAEALGYSTTQVTELN